MSRLVVAVLLALSLRGCVAYEFEHEFWIRVDGSGSVNVTARPELWAAMKGVRVPADQDSARQTVRALFESSGLRVRRVTLTHRAGRPYVFVAADFPDVNRLAGTPAFPDLSVSLRPEGENLRLDGRWTRPSGLPDVPVDSRDGLMAVRFHLPSKVYSHHNAFSGVERGNIVGWRETIAEGLAGRPLEVGAVMDRRSILRSTVGLFAVAIVVALAIMATVLWWVIRKGRKAQAAAP